MFNPQLFSKHFLAKPLANKSAFLRRLPKHSIGLELGVHLGGFAEQIINEVNPDRLYLVDAWDYIKENPPALYFDIPFRYEEVCKKFKDKDNVVIIKKYSKDALEDIADGSLDWIYIDANHQYDFIKFDIYHWCKKVKSNGLICGHDYCDECPGVVKAVDEFLIDYGWYMKYYTTQDKYSSFCLEKRCKIL